MNLQKLFEIQAGLDYHIVKEKGLEGQDLLDEKILALQVELGELANEWRGFKFWSKDQEPRTKGQWLYHEGVKDGKFIDAYENPLLEEYVDCLHFILSIGLEKGWTPVAADLYVKASNITEQFNGLFYEIAYFKQNKLLGNYHNIIKVFTGLGEMLGFTWEQVEQAYLTKNQINHERQVNGY